MHLVIVVMVNAFGCGGECIWLLWCWSIKLGVVVVVNGFGCRGGSECIWTSWLWQMNLVVVAVVNVFGYICNATTNCHCVYGYKMRFYVKKI